MVVETIFVMAFIWKYGFFALFLEIILSLVLGFILISKFGILDFVSEVRNITPQTIFGNFGTVFGGFLILLPGVLSDTVGIIIIVVSLLMKFLGDEKATNIQADIMPKNTNSKPKRDTRDDIIDVEVIE